MSSEVSNSGNSQSGEKHVVLLIHGIRDFGRWQQMVVRALDATDILAIPVKYGYFDVLRFLAPFQWPKRRPIERLKREFDDARAAYPDATLSVIAHSFGTFAVTRVLEENSHLHVWRLILCGSVVSQDFRWQRLQAQIGDPGDAAKRNYIVNECGSRDVWPVLGKAAGWGYGAAGTDGFGTVLVHDRWHKGGHALFFTSPFVRKYWLPFLQSGEIVAGKGEQREDAPFWLKLIGFLPLRWILPIVLALFLFTVGLIGIAFVQPNEHHQRQTHELQLEFDTSAPREVDVSVYYGRSWHAVKVKNGQAEMDLPVGIRSVDAIIVENADFTITSRGPYALLADEPLRIQVSATLGSPFRMPTVSAIDDLPLISDLEERPGKELAREIQLHYRNATDRDLQLFVLDCTNYYSGRQDHWHAWPFPRTEAFEVYPSFVPPTDGWHSFVVRDLSSGRDYCVGSWQIFKKKHPYLIVTGREGSYAGNLEFRR